MPDKPIGYRSFVDGTTRPVWRETDGRQFVIDDDGQPVYGTWIYPDDEEADVRFIREPRPC